MMKTHDEAPFSIAVALPTPLKSLVERMLHGLLREQPQQAARWHLRDTGDTDVTFRLHGGDGQSISPNLLADVRSRDGRSETLVIEGAWRAGAMTAALDSIAAIIVTRRASQTPLAQQAPTALALEWLGRWCELRARGVTTAALDIGNRTVARIDVRRAVAHFAAQEARADAPTLAATMARDGWSLAAADDGQSPAGPASPLKPLLWQFGVLSGEHGALPALLDAVRLRLKGWPYLAAGGHRSYAELVKHLRDGDNDRASLQALGLAPRAIIDGFLNACFVCDFFHDAATSAPAPAPRAPALRNDGGDPVVISAIRRTLGIVRS
ncbi:MAG: hypothetical protein AMXMBFR59_29560 [Rhodanobacteraceae bacterium]